MAYIGFFCALFQIETKNPREGLVRVVVEVLHLDLDFGCGLGLDRHGSNPDCLAQEEAAAIDLIVLGEAAEQEVLIRIEAA